MGKNTNGEKVVEAGARSVAGKPLPAPTSFDGISQILFYQYVEPVWSARRQGPTHLSTSTYLNVCRFGSSRNRSADGGAGGDTGAGGGSRRA
jgi:hypothetical protein